MVAGSQPQHSSTTRESVRLGNPFEDAVNLAGSFNPENLVALQANLCYYLNLMLTIVINHPSKSNYHLQLQSVGNFHS